MSRGHEWWKNWFLGMAQYVSTASKDPSTKVGCVVVGPDREVRSTGYNGFPRGITDTDERLQDRQIKYPLVVHAEMNAVLHAARIGLALKGCTAYSTWPPCTRCAVSLIQAGIVRVIWPQVTIPERWAEDFSTACSILQEARIIIPS